jgi:hypothetical protein
MAGTATAVTVTGAPVGEEGAGDGEVREGEGKSGSCFLVLSIMGARAGLLFLLTRSLRPRGITKTRPDHERAYHRIRLRYILGEPVLG